MYNVEVGLAHYLLGIEQWYVYGMGPLESSYFEHIQHDDAKQEGSLSFLNVCAPNSLNEENPVPDHVVRQRIMTMS